MIESILMALKLISYILKVQIYLNFLASDNVKISTPSLYLLIILIFFVQCDPPVGREGNLKVNQRAGFLEIIRIDFLFCANLNKPYAN